MSLIPKRILKNQNSKLQKSLQNRINAEQKLMQKSKFSGLSWGCFSVRMWSAADQFKYSAEKEKELI